MTPEEWAWVVDTLGPSEALALVRAMENAKRMFRYPAPAEQWDDQGCYFDRSTL